MLSKCIILITDKHNSNKYSILYVFNNTLLYAFALQCLFKKKQHRYRLLLLSVWFLTFCICFAFLLVERFVTIKSRLLLSIELFKAMFTSMGRYKIFAEFKQFWKLRTGGFSIVHEIVLIILILAVAL